MSRLERILCVEEDLDIQAVIRLALEVAGGFTLQLCGSGSEALDVAPVFRPHLAMLSMEGRGMDGPSTLDALRRQPGNARLPAIFMAAADKPDAAPASPAEGALAVIAKPFHPMDLAWEIRAHWLKHHQNGKR